MTDHETAAGAGDFHEHDAAGCLDCECASAPMNSAPCTCQPCDHATTEFLNDVAGWCCSHCGASVDPDASAATSEPLPVGDRVRWFMARAWDEGYEARIGFMDLRNETRAEDNPYRETSKEQADD